MTRVLSLVLAALLVCSLSAAALPGGQSLGASSEVEDGDWLAPSGSTTNGSGYVGIDAGATLDADADRLESRYEEYRLVARLEHADSDAERRTIVREETKTLERNVEALRERERDAYRAYHAGEIDERALAIELAAVHSSAVDLERSVSTLSEHVKSVPDVDRGAEFEMMKVETATMQGPVRERTAEALRGEIDPVRVYVEADDGGVVLATVENGRFYREAYRDDARAPAAEPRIHSLGESEERIADLYPEVFTAARWSYSEIGYGTHRGTGTYPEGEITLYLDRATTDVYREELTLDLGRVETTPLESETANGMRLSLEATTPGGPAVVSLVNDETDAPLSGEITVGDDPLGSTDDDGEVWFVLPDERTTITASTGSTTIELTIERDAFDGETSADSSG